MSCSIKKMVIFSLSLMYWIVLLNSSVSTEFNPAAGSSKQITFINNFLSPHRANAISSSLPYGKEKKVEIARALCGDNIKVICLDEPAAGLNSVETEELSKTIQYIRDKLKITIFLIEHDMSLVMDISDYVVVLDNGKVIAKGEPKIVRNNPKVIEAYLGSDAVQEKSKKTKK